MATASWEDIVDNRQKGGEITQRLEVPGGWLYRVVMTGKHERAGAMTFVPRPDEIVLPVEDFD